jgi:hypothetical protein
MDETGCMADYNPSMHGVENGGQYLALYPFMRKTSKGPKYVFFYLLQCALFNSSWLFQKSN